MMLGGRRARSRHSRNHARVFLNASPLPWMHAPGGDAHTDAQRDPV